MEPVYALGVVGVNCVLGVVAIVAIVFGNGFKGKGPGGVSIETKPPNRK